ncbi:hypothetical protein B0T25DRAFT_574385 [Lasiosphaeria hispida]|uniref:Uncharacterized protein n=1 Tax=Lasiosphaeria hispida TaxID=260671 RepID=A0AAJ0H836_9PEZI|nr:hypothetical protein B0T25DRAFT_574385 [Lasiosphaeria hispida]
MTPGTGTIDESSEPVMNAFTYAMQRSPQTTGFEGDIINLLHIAIRLLPNLYIVVDGVDECDKPEKFFLEFLPLITVPGDCRVAIDTLNKADIRLYCEAGLSTLVESHMLPHDVYSLGDMADDGMFLWAVLMFIYLESLRLAPTPERAAAARLKAIKDFRYPDGLDNMQVFQWIILRNIPIAAHQLQDILEFSYDRDQEGQSAVLLHIAQYRSYNPENFDAIRSMITMACSSLVVLEDSVSSPTDNLKRYSFIYISAVEFLS